MKNAPIKRWLPLFAFFIELLAAPCAYSAQYVVGGFTLGERVASDSASYRSYTCRPSDDFARVTRCERSQQQRGSGGSNYVLSSTILHNENGIALYLMANAAPVSVNRNAVEREIEVLSQEIKERPAKVDWSTEGQPTSVIALWGQIKLEELGSEEIAKIAAGGSPKRGILVDSFGDLRRSANENQPIYRITGGPGYLYSSSFDRSGRGHRHYVAIDGSQLAPRLFERAVSDILEKDQSLAGNDYQLWPDVAKLTRRLSLDTSPNVANDALAKVFEKFPSKKLYSRVWSILPGGTIDHIASHKYWMLDTYLEKTEHPEIRRNILTFLAEKPADPFVEFLYYVVGDFDKALSANPTSSFHDMYRYAIGHKIVDSLLQDTIKVIKTRNDLESLTNVDVLIGVDYVMSFLNEHPDLYDNKPLATLVPTFADRSAAAKPHFEFVLQNKSSAHADDAAYMLGWLAWHEGKSNEALVYFSQAMTVGNGDYKIPGAVRRSARILERFSSDEQLPLIEANPTLGRQPGIAYIVARSLYREYKYALAIEAAQRALRLMDVASDRLPATTDAKRIEAAIRKIASKQFDEQYESPNLVELPYLIQSSRELSEYETYLNSIARESPENVSKRARAIIIKYSRLTNPEEQSARRLRGPELSHRDLRQAVHAIDATLKAAPSQPQYARLREWLHYRKIRILAVFAPAKVSQAFAAMEAELPSSQLLDDALVEQLYAEGIGMQDVESAKKTFQKLLEKYPRGNAVDNAYSWMGIIFRCTKRLQEARNINQEILRRFPLTRHARYARERMANPDGCGLDEFSDL